MLKKVWLFYFKGVRQKEYLSFQSYLNGAYLVPRQIKVSKVGIQIKAVPLVEEI